MPTTFFLEPRPYVFFVEKRFGRTQRIYVERREATSSFRLCPAGSGQEVGGCSVNDFLCISGISRLIICLGRGIIKL